MASTRTANDVHAARLVGRGDDARRVCMNDQLIAGFLADGPAHM